GIGVVRHWQMRWALSGAAPRSAPSFQLQYRLPMASRQTVELHAHPIASEDCLMRPADIVQTCRARGIDRLAVTDHNTVRGARAVQALAPALVILGEEIMTTQGELLAYFVQEEVPAGL